jgi:hypothetical protein
LTRLKLAAAWIIWTIAVAIFLLLLVALIPFLCAIGLLAIGLGWVLVVVHWCDDTICKHNGYTDYEAVFSGIAGKLEGEE